MKTNTRKVRQGFAALGLAATLLVGAAGVAGAAEAGSDGNPSGGAAAATEGRRRHRAVIHLRRTGFEAAAQVLGQEPKELLKTMAQNSQTLAQIAGDQTEAVIDAAVAAIRAEVEEAHDSGRITDEQYQRIVERMDAHLRDRVTDIVQNWVPKPRVQS